jgi:hypothetical protein
MSRFASAFLCLAVPLAAQVAGFSRANFHPVGIWRVMPLGQRLGLRTGALVSWGADPETVSEVLATDELGQAAAWVVHTGAGVFVRIPVFESEGL